MYFGTENLIKIWTPELYWVQQFLEMLLDPNQNRLIPKTDV